MTRTVTPLKIGLVLVWKVENTYKAAFDVDNYEHFVLVQSDAALRKLAGLYPYDDWEGHEAEITLRGGGEEVNDELEKEISDRLKIAGINVIEARINYIAYAEEIAGAMLRRQQATAVVAARFKIVEGAVSMVEMALEQLSEKGIIDLDEEKKAAMVSNLMVVLCGDKDRESDHQCRHPSSIVMQKKSFVIRIDPDKLSAIEKWASDEFRSTNGQIEWILDQALRKSGRQQTKKENKNERKDEK